ncbi:MAG: class I SAM-dependent DNA methyltransferase [Planctomycetes bacterium]|nr:class I SAM-dependent DNA methyltransferase [Planctomycetota bacterium]
MDQTRCSPYSVLMLGQLTPALFIAKWSRTELSERAASQEHFIDLCHMLGQPTPAEHDATGAEYTFEKGVSVTGTASRGSAGERGFADVWWRGKFAWEYKRKGKHRDLREAYRQLCQYREALENPPLLVVCDIARTEIHTNFTGTAKQLHVIKLVDLDKPESLDLLRRVFTDPNSLKPTITTQVVTEEVAEQFGTLARALRSRDHEPQETAHFLMKCMFCLFAEDVGLLPDHLFERLLKDWRSDPANLTPALTDLFAKMQSGGRFGVERIAHFNGGLFDDAPALRLTAADIDVLIAAAAQDWASVEPAIFGTLFERSLDPNTRAQIGAHYTSREDIMLVVEPVVMAPLRREWETIKEKIADLLVERSRDPKAKQLLKISKRRRVAVTRTESKAGKKINALLDGFVDRLEHVSILDPACGSGNFLYVAIQQLLHLEKEVITFAARPDIGVGLFPQVRPTQLHGIEINPYAAELAQVVIWIGYLQWMRDNGFIDGIRAPILEPLQTIECRDAILDLSDPDNPKPATWPKADFIIGNPPFLGTKMLRGGLGDEYVDTLFDVYEGQVPGFADLCCYWFELARHRIKTYADTRAGLLATQAIRNDAARVVLQRIKKTGGIFEAWSDRKWILDGANVHVAIVCFDGGTDAECKLDGRMVLEINSDLSVGVDVTTARHLEQNKKVAFVGDVKGGPFDVDFTIARQLLSQPAPTARSPLDVLRPYVNGLDVSRRMRAIWVVDFGTEMRIETAALYGPPFEHVKRHVQPMREKGRPSRKEWWLHMRPCPSMRDAVESCLRYIATPTLTKYRLFVWMSGRALPDHQLVVYGRSDDYFFGVLHSSIHELWALRQGTQLEDRPRYTPTTCFETFPLPWAPGKEPTDDPLYQEIAQAAKELNEQRERWLNPPEWIEPIARAVDADDDFLDVPQEARELIRQSAIMARAAKDKNLKKRTLTNLYNQRPTWLRLAHERLDKAVLSAYAAVDPEGDWSSDWAEVWIETGAGQPLPEDHELCTRRTEVDQLVLANLLRMNLQRAGSE